MNRLFRLTLLALAALLLPGCVTFQREWHVWSEPKPKAPKGTLVFGRKQEPPPTPQSAYDGRWEGRWVSDRHKIPFSGGKAESGSLRCVFTKIDPYRYRANFRAGWLLGKTDYLAELYGRQRGDTLYLKGEFPVSRIFGKFRYEGTVTRDRFTLNYDGGYDTGTFEMQKVR